MEFKLKLEVTDDTGATTLCDLTTLTRGELTPETLGLHLAESHQILQALQSQMMNRQLQAYLAKQKHCPDCGKILHSKGGHRKSMHTLFGECKVHSPRLKRCTCATQGPRTFSPLTRLFSENLTPELWYIQSKWAALAAYGVTTQLLKEAFPVGKKLNAMTVRNHTLKLARRCEPEVGQNTSLLEGMSMRGLKMLPPPNGPLMVGLDGGYVRKTGKEGFFEVITGKSLLQFTRDEKAPLPPVRCFAFVQGVGASPKQRLIEVLKTQGVQPHQSITFMSDGGEALRRIQRNFSPTAEHILDWFHLTMRLTVLGQTLKGVTVIKAVPEEDEEQGVILTPEGMMADLTRVKHFLWHGNTVSGLRILDDVLQDLEAFEQLPERAQRFLVLLQEFRTYVFRNRGFIVNYGERYRNKEEISTAFVESTVNWVISKRFCKKQQMGWSVLGAHLLLQVRTQVLNEELENTFRTWYPAFRTSGSEAIKAG